MTGPAHAAPLDFFKALAHESRLKILGFTAQRAHSVQELARAAGLTEPTASHHLAILRDAGLVSAKPDGTTHWYSFEPGALRQMAKSLLSRDGVAGFADAPKGDSYEARTIKGYLLPNGRLKTFPASRKKRRVFCAWFARMFDDARDYREAEVNGTCLPQASRGAGRSPRQIRCRRCCDRSNHAADD